MHKITYTIIGLLIGISGSFLFAQNLIQEEIQTAKIQLTKADKYYIATRTPEILENLTTSELLITKENYNNNEKLYDLLTLIYYKLDKIEKNTR